MNGRSVDLKWLMQLRTNLWGPLGWLSQLSASVESLVDFGCWTSEPFALMWILDAAEVKVVDKREEYIAGDRGRKVELAVLEKKIPQAFEGRSIEFIIADMSEKIDHLCCNHFDLAFCQDVIYQIHSDGGSAKVQDAINEMARIVKPGGWVIAVEPQIGAKFEEVKSNIFGCESTVPVRVSGPMDISSLFESAGLMKASLANAPDWSYCYKKPWNGGPVRCTPDVTSLCSR